MLRTNTPDELSVFFPCVVHKASSCQTWVLQTVSEDISAVVACALFMSGGGSTAAFRKHLLAVMKERFLLIHTDPPGGHIMQHRMQVYDVFLGGPVSSAESKRCSRQRRAGQRAVLDLFLAGDLQDTSRVAFYSRGRALTYENAEWLLERYVVPALVPVALPVFPRSRWLGGEAAIDWMGLVQAHHGLLQPVLQRLTLAAGETVPRDPNPMEAVLAAWDGSVDAAVSISNEAHAAEDADASEGNPSAAASASPEKHKDAAASSSWAEMKRSFKQKVRQWSQNRDINVLPLIRSAMSIVTVLLYNFLGRSSQQWEREQQRSARKGQQRKYRPSEFATGDDLEKAFSTIKELFHSAPRALPVCSWRMGFKIQLFRMLARAAGAIHFLLRSTCKACPYAVFQLLDPASRDAAAAKLLEMPPCLQDSFTENFLKQFPSEDSMKGKAAQMRLHAVASMSDIDVSSIECRHASVRSLLDQRERSWSPLFDLVSADFLCRQISSQLQPFQAVRPQPQRKRRRPPKKKRGGGGAQRAFFSEKLRGQCFWKLPRSRKRALFRRLGQEFRTLPAAERSRLQDVGEAATISHRAGGVSFPGGKHSGSKNHVVAVAAAWFS